jgi:replicative DNA helicase
MIEDARVAGGKIPGISTGFESLDASTNGYQGGQLWLLAARPGAGKTAMLMNLVENLVSANIPTAIYSAEMFAEELAIRSLSGQTRIDSLKLARGDIGKMDFVKLRDAINNSHKWPLWIDDRADMRLVDIQVSARQLVKQSGVRVIFVDYLQLIKEPEGSRNREDAVRRLSDGLKQLAKELDITVVTLAQLNRDAEKRGRPVKSDLRDSGAIEQDANVILLLNPTEPDSQDPVVDVEVIVAKCRGGKMGPISFEFDRPVTTFREKREY